MIGTPPHPGSQIQAPQSGGDTIFARLRKRKGLVAWCGLGGRGRHAVRPEVPAGKCGLANGPGWVIAGQDGIPGRRVLYTKQSGEKRSLISRGRVEGSDPAGAPRNDCSTTSDSGFFLSMNSRPRPWGPSPGAWSDPSARAETAWPKTVPSPALALSDPGRSAGALLGGRLWHGCGSQCQHAPRAAEVFDVEMAARLAFSREAAAKSLRIWSFSERH